jgi:hypothetical protein
MANGAFERLGRDAGAAVATKLAIFGVVGIVSIEICRGKVLD